LTHPQIEDYLAIIYVMERDEDEIIAARLTETLEVAPPTVTVALKRMERDGWK
jgi:Mn-dependent DtxR family transcriptional regulator